MNSHRIIAALLCAALSACDKNAVQELITAPPAAAQIKFFNFGVGAPNVNFYANDRKLTGISSTTGVESTLGTAYGAAAAGGFYVAIDPGQYDFSGRITATTDKDLGVACDHDPRRQQALLPISEWLLQHHDEDPRAFILEDDFTIPTSFATASVRFVNAISNANPMALYARATTADSTVFPIGGAVAYKSVAAWTSIPTGSYDLYTRYPGSTTNVILRTAVGFAGGRVYTVTARGDVTSTATTRVPTLDNTANF